MENPLLPKTKEENESYSNNKNNLNLQKNLEHYLIQGSKSPIRKFLQSLLLALSFQFLLNVQYQYTNYQDQSQYLLNQRKIGLFAGEFIAIFLYFGINIVGIKYYNKNHGFIDIDKDKFPMKTQVRLNLGILFILHLLYLSINFLNVANHWVFEIIQGLQRGYGSVFLIGFLGLVYQTRYMYNINLNFCLLYFGFVYFQYAWIQENTQNIEIIINVISGLGLLLSFVYMTFISRYFKDQVLSDPFKKEQQQQQQQQVLEDQYQGKEGMENSEQVYKEQEQLQKENQKNNNIKNKKFPYRFMFHYVVIVSLYSFTQIQFQSAKMNFTMSSNDKMGQSLFKLALSVIIIPAFYGRNKIVMKYYQSVVYFFRSTKKIKLEIFSQFIYIVLSIFALLGYLCEFPFWVQVFINQFSQLFLIGFGIWMIQIELYSYLSSDESNPLYQLPEARKCLKISHKQNSKILLVVVLMLAIFYAISMIFQGLFYIDYLYQENAPYIISGVFILVNLIIYIGLAYQSKVEWDTLPKISQLYNIKQSQEYNKISEDEAVQLQKMGITPQILEKQQQFYLQYQQQQKQLNQAETIQERRISFKISEVRGQEYPETSNESSGVDRACNVINSEMFNNDIYPQFANQIGSEQPNKKQHPYSDIQFQDSNIKTPKTDTNRLFQENEQLKFQISTLKEKLQQQQNQPLQTQQQQHYYEFQHQTTQNFSPVQYFEEKGESCMEEGARKISVPKTGKVNQNISFEQLNVSLLQQSKGHFTYQDTIQQETKRFSFKEAIKAKKLIKNVVSEAISKINTEKLNKKINNYNGNSNTYLYKTEQNSDFSQQIQLQAIKTFQVFGPELQPIKRNIYTQCQNQLNNTLQDIKSQYNDILLAIPQFVKYSNPQTANNSSDSIQFLFQKQFYEQNLTDYALKQQSYKKEQTLNNLHIMEQITDILIKLKEKFGLSHGNLSLTNILLQNNNNKTDVFIDDLPVQLFKSFLCDNQHSYSFEKAVWNINKFQCPEVLLDIKIVNEVQSKERQDIYNLGCIMLKLFTNLEPWEGVQNEWQLNDIKNKDISLTKYTKIILKNLKISRIQQVQFQLIEKLVEKSTSFDPQSRISLREFKQELIRIKEQYLNVIQLNNVITSLNILMKQKSLQELEKMQLESLYLNGQNVAFSLETIKQALRYFTDKLCIPIDQIYNQLKQQQQQLSLLDNPTQDTLGQNLDKFIQYISEIIPEQQSQQQKQQQLQEEEEQEEEKEQDILIQQ